MELEATEAPVRAHTQVIIVGGGPAGLATAVCLQRRGQPDSHGNFCRPEPSGTHPDFGTSGSGSGGTFDSGRRRDWFGPVW